MRTTATTRYVYDADRGRLYPVPMGAEGEGDPPSTREGGGDGGGDGDPPGEGGGGGDEPKTFTQQQLSQMLAREKNQGRKAAQTELAETLGVSLDEAKTLIQAAREREDADKSEAQRAADRAAERERIANEAASAAARERYEARVERALIRAGIDPSDDERLGTVARLVDADTDAELADITEAVDGLKEKFPEMFGARDDGDGTPPRRTPSSDPKGTPPRNRPTTTSLDRGRERAKDYKNRGGVQFTPSGSNA